MESWESALKPCSLNTTTTLTLTFYFPHVHHKQSDCFLLCVVLYNHSPKLVPAAKSSCTASTVFLAGRYQHRNFIIIIPYVTCILSSLSQIIISIKLRGSNLQAHARTTGPAPYVHDLPRQHFVRYGTRMALHASRW